MFSLPPSLVVSSRRTRRRARVAGVIGAVCVFWLGACRRADDAPHEPAPDASKSGVTTIHDPPRLTSIESNELDGLGRPIRVACVTCHSAREVDGGAYPTKASDLRDFHGGLTF